MQCDLSVDHEEEIKSEKVLAPNLATIIECTGLNGLEVEQGPLALSYEENAGWIAEKLGPNSRH